MSIEACISLANVTAEGAEAEPREFHVTRGLGLSWMSLPAPRLAGSRVTQKSTNAKSAIAYTTRPGSWIRLG